MTVSYYDFDDALYIALLKIQGGRCVLCRRNAKQAKRKNQKHPKLVVDHDHLTGHVRGLLCSTCNTGLGMLQDNPQLMRRAAHYLTQHRELARQERQAGAQAG